MNSLKNRCHLPLWRHYCYMTSLYRCFRLMASLAAALELLEPSPTSDSPYFQGDVVTLWLFRRPANQTLEVDFRCQSNTSPNCNSCSPSHLSVAASEGGMWNHDNRSVFRQFRHLNYIKEAWFTIKHTFLISHLKFVLTYTMGSNIYWN